MDDVLTIGERFCGPPGAGNGGYVCGRLAALLPQPAAAAVRLRAPVPLDVPLRVERDVGTVRLVDDARTLAEARQAAPSLTAPAPTSFADAAVASRDYAGFREHAFPRCFVCGPQREVGDGLRIFPGPIAQRDLVAAPWRPDRSLADDSGRVRHEFLWSALDCSGGFAVLPVPAGKAILLGELCARIDGDVAADENCTVVGWSLGIDGRKRHAGSAVYSAAGRPVAVAQAIWIEIDRSAFAA